MALDKLLLCIINGVAAKFGASERVVIGGCCVRGAAELGKLILSVRVLLV